MTTDEALAELRAELADGWHVSDIMPSRSSGSRDPEGRYQADSGWYRTTHATSWYVEVEEDGWETEAGRAFEWGATIADAAIKLRDHLQRRRLDPHSAHIEDGWVVADCDGCARDYVDLALAPAGLPVYVK